MRRSALVLALCLAAPQVPAHPHVFVNVALALETDDLGRVTGVEVTWAYDDLFSMLILSDYGLDPDGDGTLSGQERAQLTGFDLADWPEGFDGALFAETPGGRLGLGVPEPLSLDLEEGRLVTRHRRSLEPVPPDRLSLRPFDPYYYAALSLTEVTGLPEGCEAAILTPDLAEAERAFETMGGGEEATDFEELRPGRLFAQTAVLSCAPRS